MIDRLGGTNKVAQLFEISPASVSGWRRDGIPKARLQTLRLMRPELFVSDGTDVPVASGADSCAA